jgi:cysteinyl-tRNA synthetase
MNKTNFDDLYENFLPASMKVVTRVRYPKQIQFSENFLNSLKEEFQRLQTIEENENAKDETEVRPIKNYKDKFLKAVNFCISNF